MALPAPLSPTIEDQKTAARHLDGLASACREFASSSLQRGSCLAAFAGARQRWLRFLRARGQSMHTVILRCWKGPAGWAGALRASPVWQELWVGWVLAPYPGLCPLSQWNAARSWWVQGKPPALLTAPGPAQSQGAVSSPGARQAPALQPSASWCTQSPHTQPLSPLLATVKSGSSFSCKLSSGHEILLGLSLGDEKLSNT